MLDAIVDQCTFIHVELCYSFLSETPPEPEPEPEPVAAPVRKPVGVAMPGMGGAGFAMPGLAAELAKKRAEREKRASFGMTLVSLFEKMERKD